MSQVQDMQTEMQRLFASASDALSDDIVARLGTTMGEGLHLLDKVANSNLDKAIPVINRLIETGDLDRVVNLARVMGSAGDAMSDDIMGRLGALANELMCLADRISRTEGLWRLLDLLEREHMVDTIAGLMEAAAAARASHKPKAQGGIMGLLNTMKDPQVQESLQFLSVFAQAFKSGR